MCKFWNAIIWIIYQNFYVERLILQKKKKHRNWCYKIEILILFLTLKHHFLLNYIDLDNHYIGKNIGKKFVNLMVILWLIKNIFFCFVIIFLKNISELNAFIFLYLQIFINFKEFQNSSCQHGLSVTIILQKSLNANEVSDD